MLHPKIAEELRELRDKMEADGKLLSQSQLDTYYQNFRQRFGPKRLRNLDGVELLHTMYGGKEYDSLVYWLEYKNDDEFLSPRFGSIAGHGAFKFGLYRDSTIGEWITGTPQKKQVILEQQAIQRACERRNQLLAGCDLLDSTVRLPALPAYNIKASVLASLQSIYKRLLKYQQEYADTPISSRKAEVTYNTNRLKEEVEAEGLDYDVACGLLQPLLELENAQQYLQREMARVAPDVQDSAWAHKYFSLIYSDKIDGFHNTYYQHHHLLRLLQNPPAEAGRYLAAAQFVEIATDLGMSLHTVSALLNERDGRPRHYWRVGTSDRKEAANQWPMMCDNGVVAIGWPNLGDLTPQLHADLKADIRAGLELPPYSRTGSVLTNSTRQILLFVETMQQGDIVIASDGMTILGVGRIKSGYTYKANFRFPHQRQVEWLSFEEWQLPIAKEGLLTTVCDLRKYDNQLALEEHIFGRMPPPLPPKNGVIANTGRQVTPSLPPLSGTPARIEGVLQRKGQVILYGPPGTGKTYWAEKAARELAARSTFGKALEVLTEEEKTVVNGDAVDNGLVRWCCFHPAYGYEDFLEGYRPRAHEGQMLFELRNGIFKTLCEDAQANLNRNFYLLVDEINRGDIPRIFGELLTILESNKRGKTVILPLSKTPFAVPKNVYVIGTMNTADRSIALLDAALRRRFGFIELMPDSSTLGRTLIEGIPLGAWLDALNARICQYIGRDARNLQIGHSYFLENGRPIRDFAHLRRVLREDIVPLLEEYCYEDYVALKNILGNGLVNEQKQQIREELFDPSQQDELVAALLEPCPEITATPQAVMMEAEAENEELVAENEADEDIEAMGGSE